MLDVLGNCAREDDGVASRAVAMHSRALAFIKRVLPENHPAIGTSMGNLASTYSALGRHDEALKLQEETLTFNQRVLAENHHDIATSMSNLALTFGALGRHDEALKLQE
jgi:tetratricopeptide (TPR) repeat protein